MPKACSASSCLVSTSWQLMGSDPLFSSFLFLGPRCLARYHADGQLIEPRRAHPDRSGLAHGSDALPIVNPRPTVREIISARGQNIRKENPDRSCATYTGQVNLLSTGHYTGVADTN